MKFKVGDIITTSAKREIRAVILTTDDLMALVQFLEIRDGKWTTPIHIWNQRYYGLSVLKEKWCICLPNDEAREIHAKLFSEEI
jgi:hypothetical protein